MFICWKATILFDKEHLLFYADLFKKLNRLFKLKSDLDNSLLGVFNTGIQFEAKY